MNQEYWYPLNKETIKDMQKIWCDEYEIRIKPKKVKRWKWRTLIAPPLSQDVSVTTDGYLTEEDIREIKSQGWVTGFEKIIETEQEFDA